MLSARYRVKHVAVSQRADSQSEGMTLTYVPHFWQNGQASPAEEIELMKS
jgi:hypothetical protein